jgi:hypothetical protein
MNSNVLYDLKQQFNGLETIMDRLRELDDRVYNLAPPKTEVGKSQEKMNSKQLERKKKEFAAAINLGDS